MFGPNLYGEGVLEGKMNSRNRGGGLPLHWDSEKGQRRSKKKVS